jgi:sec-independent protein translocase protein TatB
MFEISWSELLILGIVVLIFVGPKELPAFMRTLGRYAAVVRRHANEFKAQFDAAVREAELDDMRKEVENMQASINAEIMKGTSSLEEAATSTKLASPEVSERPITSQTENAEALSPPMPAPPRMES